MNRDTQHPFIAIDMYLDRGKVSCSDAPSLEKIFVVRAGAHRAYFATTNYSGGFMNNNLRRALCVFMTMLLAAFVAPSFADPPPNKLYSLLMQVTPGGTQAGTV